MYVCIFFCKIIHCSSLMFILYVLFHSLTSFSQKLAQNPTCRVVFCSPNCKQASVLSSMWVAGGVWPQLQLLPWTSQKSTLYFTTSEPSSRKCRTLKELFFAVLFKDESNKTLFVCLQTVGWTYTRTVWSVCMTPAYHLVAVPVEAELSARNKASPDSRLKLSPESQALTVPLPVCTICVFFFML